MDDLSRNATAGRCLLIAIACLCVTLNALADMQARDASAHALHFESCVIQGPAGSGQARGQCATFSVPEDYANVSGRQLELRVFKLATKHHTANSDAVTFIQGGPGGSSVELAVILGLQNSGLRRNRDIVLLDQRGTGKSAPLRCDFSEQQLQTLSEEKINKLADNCVQKLSRDADLSQYTTSVAIRDLEQLRKAMNYTQWNVIAGSYGTRVAQHYLRRYPDSVRTMTIEGVIPTGMEIISSVPNNAQKALENLFAQCEANEQCQQAFPHLPDQFKKVRAELTANPQQVELAHPTTGELDNIEFNEAAFNLAIRMMLYSPESKSLLPLMIKQAAEGKRAPLAAQAMLFGAQLSESMNVGMHNSVVCSEDLSQLSLSRSDRDEIANTFLGLEFVNFMTSICKVWPKGIVDEDFFEPFKSQHPVLLISGEYDPVTPVVNGDRAAKDYVNSLHLVAAGQGHSLYHPSCSRGLINRFVRSGTVNALDTSCFERLDGPPFFTSSMGHAP